MTYTVQKWQDHESQKRLKNCTRLEEIKNIKQLNANCDSRLDPGSGMVSI